MNRTTPIEIVPGIVPVEAIRGRGAANILFVDGKGDSHEMTLEHVVHLLRAIINGKVKIGQGKLKAKFEVVQRGQDPRLRLPETWYEADGLYRRTKHTRTEYVHEKRGKGSSETYRKQAAGKDTAKDDKDRIQTHAKRC